MNPRAVWACQPVAFITSARVAPPFRSSRPTTVAVLLPSRATGAAAAPLFLALGRALGGAGLLARLGLRGRALSPLCAHLGLPFCVCLTRPPPPLGVFPPFV